MEHIQSTSGLTLVVDIPTTIFEDNAGCIEQLKKGYIKGDNTKHIAPKFFYSHQQQLDLAFVSCFPCSCRFRVIPDILTGRVV